MAQQESNAARWVPSFELLDEASKTDSGRWLPDLREAARSLAAYDFPAPPRLTGSESYADCVPALQSASTQVLVDLRAALERRALTAVAPWVEKLMRVCEIRQATLKQRLSTDVQEPAALQRKVQILRLLFLEYFFHTSDSRFLNIVLKLADPPWVLSLEGAGKGRASKRYGSEAALLALAAGVLLKYALQIVRDSQWKQPLPEVPKGRLVDMQQSPTQVEQIADSVVVFSPSRYSLNTLAVTSLLRQRGVPVCGIAIRKLINPQRLFQEFSRDGMRLVRKVSNKLILKKRAYRPLPFPTLPDRLTDLGVASGRVDALAADHGIDVVTCQTLNDPVVHRFLKSRSPRLVVFTGGGIIREETLKLAGDGVLNCHMGCLPFYRGMDVVEWPILQGHADELGFTVHFMDSGIDTGNILGVFPMSPANADTIQTLRIKYEVLMAEGLAEMAVRWLTGRVQAIPQASDAGRQHFIMHPTLGAIAAQRYGRAR